MYPGAPAVALALVSAFWLVALPSAGAVKVARKKGLERPPSPKSCTPADEDMHIVFSTGCNAFQHWQAEVLLNSAYYQGQCGKVTRIVAGCDQHSSSNGMVTHPSGSADRLIEQEDLFKSTFPDLHVHIAPSIPEAADFPWFNKPWSFHHWILNSSATIQERAIAILDPDEFFLQPLTQRAEHSPDSPFQLINSYPARLKDEVTDVAQPGVAVAQKYGLGSGWLNMFNQSTICPGGPASPCAAMTHENGARYYSVGPPYILHNQDFKKIMPTWWELMKPVYKQDAGDIQADMYAYIYAAIHHNVRHVTNINYMVSNVDTGNLEEAWDFVDSLQSMSCHNPDKALEGRKRPGFVHAASHFKACTGGERITYGATECPQVGSGSDLWNFHKGHVPATILSCDDPLITPPPDNFFAAQTHTRGRRAAFAICHLTFLVNRAALDYKRKYCEAGFNARKCTRLVVGNAPPKGSPANPFGYPLAKVDPVCNAKDNPVVA